MIITANEYREMGFDATDNELLEKCIKRAEFVLNGITGGRATLVALGTTPAADFVKQAAAFQASAIYREETALSAELSEQSGSSSKTDERVTIGDFTYSTGTSSSSSSGSASKSSSGTDFEPLDINQTVARLLRAAGCFYGAAEVKE